MDSQTLAGVGIHIQNITTETLDVGTQVQENAVSDMIEMLTELKGENQLLRKALETTQKEYEEKKKEMENRIVNQLTQIEQMFVSKKIYSKKMDKMEDRNNYLENCKIKNEAEIKRQSECINNLENENQKQQQIIQNQNDKIEYKDKIINTIIKEDEEHKTMLNVLHENEWRISKTIRNYKIFIGICVVLGLLVYI